ncbi:MULTISPECIES: hypothetical protein [unclassified Streptomyces]|uniref:hypothetical protein n=1 Tax=unclassified Streptomyces TaxID=2593676 RepID=UPI001BE5EF40|nr:MULTISPECIES: hypothetical protein [unclassified Streptomyces]MBT2408566.1 hypothetical protein [Streptomyces sp. ISL-21]MBT2608750.1 hypothetical protein [Streptomyces sp. ISL-87]
MPATEEMRAADRTGFGGRSSRFWSFLAAALFVPAALAASVLTLSSERAGRCVTYGEQCGSPLPGELFVWGVGVGAMACVIALVTPAARIRRVALIAQLLAECLALMVILSYA